VLGDDIDPQRFAGDVRRYPWPSEDWEFKFRRLDSSLWLLSAGEVLASEGDCGCVGIYDLVAAEGAPSVSPESFQSAVVSASRENVPTPKEVAGRFCYVAWNLAARRIMACTDPFRTIPLYYQAAPGRVACATDLRLFLAAGLAAPDVDPHAIYHYLNFGYVPTPFSIFKSVSKVPAGSMLSATTGGFSLTNYWDPGYSEDLEAGEEQLEVDLRKQLVKTVNRYRPGPDCIWGTLLSGGTDSSSIAGIFSADRSGSRLATFSIGYEETSYDDELPYARIAASRFGLDSHEFIVKAPDAVSLIARLAGGFDEPFGNASALPTYHCADQARKLGVEILVTGDGGDEIFGGNEWYRKNRILSWYGRVPGPLRSAVASTLRGLRGIDSRWLNRARNFVRRAAVPNPARCYLGNSFASDCFAELLTPDFRRGLESGESLELLSETYSRARTDDELHRLMYLDLKRTLIDNDLVKVGRAFRMAGIGVAYPFLDPALVDYMGKLPATYKVRGLKKRYLFKKAMKDILPHAIRVKKKRGFDVPIEIWLRQEAIFQELLHDLLLSERARSRGYFEAACIEKLIRRHQGGAWNHSVELFRLLMLELWHRSAES